MPNWTDDDGKSWFGIRQCSSCFKEFKTGGLIPAHRCANKKAVKEIHYFDEFLSENRLVPLKGKELKEFEEKEKWLTERKKRAKKNSGIKISISRVSNKEIAGVLYETLKNYLETAVHGKVRLSIKEAELVVKLIEKIGEKTT